MNDDNQIDLHASGANYALKAETHTILGCAFDVLNEHGHGLNEKCYENSLVVEFKLRGIAFNQQRRYEVLLQRLPRRRVHPGLDCLQPDCRGYQNDRAHHRSRARPDDELFESDETSSRFDPEF